MNTILFITLQDRNPKLSGLRYAFRDIKHAVTHFVEWSTVLDPEKRTLDDQLVEIKTVFETIAK